MKKQKVSVQEVVQSILDTSKSPYERVAWMMATIGWFNFDKSTSQSFVFQVTGRVDEVVVKIEHPLEELAVDHCHSTNIVRGLLCRGCNTGLGCFKEDLGRLERAINYLRSFARRC